MSRFFKSVIPFNHNELKGLGKTNKNAFTLMKKKKKKSLLFSNVPNGNSNGNDNGDKNVIIS